MFVDGAVDSNSQSMKLKMVIKSLLLLDILNNGFELDVAILSK
jgi:hypothetical protein